MPRKMIFALLLLAAFCWTGVPAQPVQLEAAQDDENEQMIRRHSLEGIPCLPDESYGHARVAPAPRILRLESEDDYVTPIFTPQAGWHSTIASEAGAPLDRDALAQQLVQLAQTDSWADFAVSKGGISWYATPEEHETLAWLLDQVRAYFAQRVRFAVFELRDAVQSGTVSAERATALRRGATLLATRTAQSREIAVISTLRSFDYVADYELNVATSASIPNPVTGTMHIGSEMALSACPAPDGSLIVRAVRGKSSLQGMRLFDGHTESGIIEMPDFTWTIEEGAARLHEGESWVFGDRYLITASIENPFTGARHASKPIATLSPDLLMRRSHTHGFAMPGASADRAGYGLEYYRPHVNGPVEAREKVAYPQVAEEVLPVDVFHMFADARVHCLGPLICLTWDAETQPPEDVLPPAPSEIRLRFRQWKLARDYLFPDDLLHGAPASETLSRLGNPSYDRNLSQLESGRIEDSQLSLSSYLASYDTNVATGVDVFDPRVCSLVTGTSLAIELGDDARTGVPLNVLYGFAPPGEIKTSRAVIPDRAVGQTATVSATAMRLSATLRVGESVSAITPMPDNPNLLIVVAVTRVEP